MKPLLTKVLMAVFCANLAGNLYAAEAEPDFFLLVDTRRYPKNAFKSAPGMQVREIASTGREIVDRTERENLFCKVKGLDKAVATFDELEKDLLFLRATEFDLGTLRDAYLGRISAKILKQLWDEARHLQ